MKLNHFRETIYVLALCSIDPQMWSKKILGFALSVLGCASQLYEEKVCGLNPLPTVHVARL
jgi:hypothetical protein